LNVFPHLFRLCGLPGVDSCPEVETIQPRIWSGKLLMSLDRLRAADLHARGITWQGAAPPWDPIDAMNRYCWLIDDLEDPADVVVVTTIFASRNAFRQLRGRGAVLPDVSDEDVLRSCLREHLRTSAEAGMRIDAFARLHDWHGRFVVGVHVRHTDESGAARTMPRLEDYLAATDKALAGRPGSSLFLATDNSSVVEIFQERYGADRVMCTTKWFAEPGQPLHKNPHCPNPLESAIEAVVDLGLLASCDYLISLGNSSFSIVADALSTAAPSDRVVLFPRQSLLRRVSRRARFVLGMGEGR